MEDNEIKIDNSKEEDIVVTSQTPEEEPIITIEYDGEDAVEQVKTSVGKGRAVLYTIAGVMLVCIMAVLAIAGWQYYTYRNNGGLNIACTPSENIEKLQTQTLNEVRPEVVMSTDTIGSVVLNLYELRGLRGEISFEIPTEADSTVYFFSRCADYNEDGKYVGSLVVGGKEYSDDDSRLGYCAMLGSRTVIGIARSEAVRDFVKEHGGHFFRQFVLVSDGMLPAKFQLHKKVERRALARLDEQLYYIESLNAETMFDFADAIRKYGFIDAIYITGGDALSYYRTADGQAHTIGNKEWKPSERNKKYAPYMVFRK